MPLNFHDSQHFTVYSSVNLLCLTKFLTIVCYGVKVFGSCALLEKYSTKRLGAGISVYFHLGVSATIIYFEHWRR